jgi:hypothetical protein
MSRSVKAEMQWRDRFSLYCGDVEVARMTGNSRASHLPPDAATWTTWSGIDQRRYTYKNEGSARRAINRRFKLPPDFGETK